MRLCLLLGLVASTISGCTANNVDQSAVEQMIEDAVAEARQDCESQPTVIQEIGCFQQLVVYLKDAPNAVLYFLDETDKIVDGLVSGKLTDAQAQLALSRIRRNTFVMADAEIADAHMAAARNQSAGSDVLLDLGLGLMLMNQSQQRPAFGMTSCSYVGNFLNCSHY